MTAENDGMRRVAIGASSTMKRGRDLNGRAPRDSLTKTHADAPLQGLQRRPMTEITDVTEHNAPEGAPTPSKADCITSADAAHILGISPDTLRTYRARREGPAFHKLGHAVIYSRSDVEAYLASRGEA